MAGPYYNSPKRPTWKQEARGLRAANQELTEQLLIFAIVAHYRNGQIRLVDAAKALRMTEDGFRRALHIAEAEALRILGNIATLDAKKPQPPPAG